MDAVNEFLILIGFVGGVALIGLVPAHLLSYFLNAGLRVMLLILSPIGFLIAWELLRKTHVLGYDTECEGECWDNLALPGLLILTGIGCELGIGTGALHRYLRDRRRSHKMAAGTS